MQVEGWVRQATGKRAVLGWGRVLSTSENRRQAQHASGTGNKKTSMECLSTHHALLNDKKPQITSKAYFNEK